MYDKRQKRGGNRGETHEHEGEPVTPMERPPLQWQELDTITKGSVTGAISSAKLNNGQTIYSFEFFKPGREDRKKKHFDPRDLVALRQVLEEVGAWIEVDRAEAAQKTVDRGVRAVRG
jgi:hypothetical protein